MRDKRSRSLLKAVSWRVVATLITFFVSLVISGKLIIALLIGISDTLIKIFAYYFHERIWEKIKFWRMD